MSILCEINNLVWKPRDKRVLDIEELKISKSERIAIIGANGAGKSSLLKVLTYLITDIQGDLKYPGFGEKSRLDVRRNISAVFQNPNLLKGKVSENIALGLKIRGVGRSEIAQKMDFWLKEFKIKHLESRNARTLSKGEAQRVSLARAMITDPEFLLLDEPFSNLDVPTRSEILTDLAEITKRQKTSLIMITHYPAEIPIIADRVLVIDEGCIIEDGTPYQVLEQPQHRITAKLVGIDNVYDGHSIDNGVYIERIGVLSTKGEPVKNTKTPPLNGKRTEVFIKPDLIKLYKEQNYNTFNYKIKKIVPMHESIILHSDTLPLLFRVSRREFMKHQFYPGQQIKIHIPHEAILLGEV